MTTPLTELPHVWTPLQIGATTVKHRIMVTGHTQLYGRDGVISDRHVDYYRERAKGGAALLILEQQAAHPAGMNYHAGCVAFDERAIPGYRALAEAVHEFGARQFVQVFAGGSQGRGTLHIHNWHPLWAVSRVPSVVYNETPMVMEQRHIDEIVDGFARSAVNIKAAGLDGIEIHAAHNQCVGEFLSPAFNKRDDRYGGSVQNRCRLLVEIAQEVRRRVGSDIAVGTRLSFDEYLGPAGITPQDSEEQLELLAATGLFDFFDISGGGYHTLHVSVSPMGAMEEGFMVPFARRAKAVVGDRAKVFVVGRILDVGFADRIVGEGSADMVAITRGHIADPFLVRKALEGRERETIRCVGANVCITRLIGDMEITCVFNPATGRERELGDGTLRATAAPRRIGVVGGGPAGLRCAATAARRGHEVVLYERGDRLGGHLNLIAGLPTREGWRVGIDNLVSPAQDAGVEIRLRTQASAAMLADEGLDVVVCAGGSTWERNGYSAVRPERDEIPGAEQDHVLDVASAIERALADPSSLGARVLIVDETDGYLPVGLAEILAGAGVSVEIVTPHLFAGADLLATLDMAHVIPRVKALGVTITAQQFVERIDGGAVELYDVWGVQRRTVEVDSVVIAMMRRPNDELYFELAAARGSETVHRVGDAVAPRKLEAVIYEGEALARAL